MTTRRTNETLILSGLVEVAAGALIGWPYALTISDPERAGRLGIQSTPRLRQWHLDLIALGGLATLVGTAVPDLPPRVAWPLALGCWTNANAFGVLVFRPAKRTTRSTERQFSGPLPSSAGVSPPWRPWPSTAAAADATCDRVDTPTVQGRCGGRRGRRL